MAWDGPTCPHCEAPLRGRSGSPVWHDENLRVNQDVMCGRCGAVMRLTFELADVSLHLDPIEDHGAKARGNQGVPK